MIFGYQELTLNELPEPSAHCAQPRRSVRGCPFGNEPSYHIFVDDWAVDSFEICPFQILIFSMIYPVFMVTGGEFGGFSCSIQKDIITSFIPSRPRCMLAGRRWSNVKIHVWHRQLGELICNEPRYKYRQLVEQKGWWMHYIQSWLVVWNIWIIFPLILGIIIPIDSYFSEGWPNHQPVYYTASAGIRRGVPCIPVLIGHHSRRPYFFAVELDTDGKCWSHWVGLGKSMEIMEHLWENDRKCIFIDSFESVDF